MGVPIRIIETIHNLQSSLLVRDVILDLVLYLVLYRGQIEFWAIIGKCALDNPGLTSDFIVTLLISKGADRALAEPFNFGDRMTDYRHQK